MDDYRIQPAEITWLEGDVPSAGAYGDVYFSREGGLEETRHVFLAQNGLPERFRACRSFTVAETGFGTGLNFLATWQAFSESAPEDAVLHYISAELHPLRPTDLARAQSAFPELASYAEELQRHWPAPAPGCHRLILGNGRIRLTLLFGDASVLFSRIHAKADAWYLDGFAPRLNPELWQEALIAQLPGLSAPEATFATFTAAGAVRRALEQAGFSVEKIPGFGKKREMLRGMLVNAQLRETEGSAAIQKPSPRACHGVWYEPDAVMRRHDTAVGAVAVIGAGAAGCAAAYALALRGVPVTVIEQHDAAAMETSFNPAAIMFPFVSRNWMPHTRITLLAREFTRRRIEALRERGHAIAGAFCGMLQCPKPSQEEQRFLEIPSRLGLDPSIVSALSAEEASQISGIPLKQGALYWPRSGWYSLADFCRASLTLPGIACRFSTQVAALEPCTEGWRLLDKNGAELLRAKQVILANAHAARALVPSLALPLATVRGQITLVPPTEESAALRTVLCHHGYLIPAYQGIHHLGATYEHDRHDHGIYEDSHHVNLERAAQVVPSFAGYLEKTAHLKGWAASRTTTPDKLPLVGATSLPGLYTTLGHGSRAAIACTFAGELLASLICGETVPLEDDLMRALRPERFSSRL